MNNSTKDHLSFSDEGTTKLTAAQPRADATISASFSHINPRRPHRTSVEGARSLFNQTLVQHSFDSALPRALPPPRVNETWRPTCFLSLEHSPTDPVKPAPSNPTKITSAQPPLPPPDFFSTTQEQLSEISPLHSRDGGSFLDSRARTHQSQQSARPSRPGLRKGDDQNKSADVIVLSRAESRLPSRSPSVGLPRAISRESLPKPPAVTHTSEELLGFFKTLFSSIGMHNKIQEFEETAAVATLPVQAEESESADRLMETSSFKKSIGPRELSESDERVSKGGCGGPVIPPLNISDISAPIAPITASLSNISMQDIKDEGSERGEYQELLLEKISEIAAEESHAEFQQSRGGRKTGSGQMTGRESELNTVKKILPAPPHKHKKSSLDELLQPLHGDGFYHGCGMLISSARQTNSMSSADFHEISPRLGAPSPKYAGGWGVKGVVVPEKELRTLEHNKAPLAMAEPSRWPRKPTVSEVQKALEDYVNGSISLTDKGERRGSEEKKVARENSRSLEDVEVLDVPKSSRVAYQPELLAGTTPRRITTAKGLAAASSFLPPQVPREKPPKKMRGGVVDDRRREVLLWREKENATILRTKEMKAMERTCREQQKEVERLRRSQQELSRTLKAVMNNKRSVENYLASKQATPQLSSRGTPAPRRVDLRELKDSLVGKLVEENCRKLARERQKILRSFPVYEPGTESLTSRILETERLSPLKRWEPPIQTEPTQPSQKKTATKKKPPKGAPVRKAKKSKSKVSKKEVRYGTPLLRMGGGGGLGLGESVQKTPFSLGTERHRTPTLMRGGSLLSGLGSTLSFDMRRPNISWTGEGFLKQQQQERMHTPQPEKTWVGGFGASTSRGGCGEGQAEGGEEEMLMLIEAGDLLSEEFERKCGFASEDRRVLLSFWRDVVASRKKGKRPGGGSSSSQGQDDHLERRQYLLSLFSEADIARGLALRES